MSLSRKLQEFLRSPKGRRVVDKAKRELAKPENQHKIKRMIARFNKRR